MTGTKDTPLVRVVIGKDGSVSMFGSKVSNGPLFPLVLNGNSFNKITWNTTGTNTVRATQRVEEQPICPDREPEKESLPVLLKT